MDLCFIVYTHTDPCHSSDSLREMGPQLQSKLLLLQEQVLFAIQYPDFAVPGLWETRGDAVLDGRAPKGG